MIVVYDRPPLWDLIDKTFNVAGKPILFAWGNRIYNPEGADVPKHLHAHEELHGERQLACVGAQGEFEIEPGQSRFDPVEAWWRRYIRLPEFRLAEEIPAHRAEYLAICKRHADRNYRARALSQIAMKLAAPLYGSLVTPAQARTLILESK